MQHEGWHHGKRISNFAFRPHSVLYHLAVIEKTDFSASRPEVVNLQNNLCDLTGLRLLRQGRPGRILRLRGVHVEIFRWSQPRQVLDEIIPKPTGNIQIINEITMGAAGQIQHVKILVGLYQG